MARWPESNITQKGFKWVERGFEGFTKIVSSEGIIITRSVERWVVTGKT